MAAVRAQDQAKATAKMKPSTTYAAGRFKTRVASAVATIAAGPADSRIPREYQGVIRSASQPVAKAKSAIANQAASMNDPVLPTAGFLYSQILENIPDQAIRASHSLGSSSSGIDGRASAFVHIRARVCSSVSSTTR